MNLRFLILPLVLGLEACVMWTEPGPATENPVYDDQELARIRDTYSTRAEIADALGKPDRSFEENKIWIYEGKSLAKTVHTVTGGITGGHRVRDMFDHRFLVIEYKADEVQYFELIEEQGECTANGICAAIGNTGDIYWTSTHLDRLSKEFRSLSGTCSLYTYTRSNSVDALVADRPLQRLYRHSYAHYKLEPGSHMMNVVSMTEQSYQKEINCAAESLVYVRVARQSLESDNLDILIVPEEIGRAEIMERWRVLLP